METSISYNDLDSRIRELADTLKDTPVGLRINCAMSWIETAGKSNHNDKRYIFFG